MGSIPVLTEPGLGLGVWSGKCLSACLPLNHAPMLISGSYGMRGGRGQASGKQLTTGALQTGCMHYSNPWLQLFFYLPSIFLLCLAKFNFGNPIPMGSTIDVYKRNYGTMEMTGICIYLPCALRCMELDACKNE